MAGNTPVYGFPYPEPTDLVADYPALGQQLAEDIEDVLPTIGGLAPATPTSIANSGGTASLSGNTVTFTTVNSVSLNGCFTSVFDHYMVKYQLSAVSGTDVFLLTRLRASGTDASGSNYDEVRSYLNTAITGTVATSQSSFVSQQITTAQPDDAAGTFNFFRPNLARKTVIDSFGRARSNSGTQYTYIANCIHTLTTQYDGFTLFPGAGTMSGTISVYGFRK